MNSIKRILKIDLPKGQSAFLWGPRKTGKTTFLKQAFPKSIIYDFLKTDLFLEMSKRPALLREQLLARAKEELQYPIILDEVQKVPQVLDEVHWLIENKGLQFILCGSSARKLKRGHANLLGGRAWRYEMFPFVTDELKEFQLLKILNQGMIPSHYLAEKEYKRSLQAYVQDYLKEEIFNEGLVRNIPAFSRFFDAFGYSHGELTNYTNIARECGVDSKTVKEYYLILVDTLLAIRLEPFKKQQSRQVLSSTPKYYLFDVGVAGIITKRNIAVEKGIEFGKAFEHFIITELNAYRVYKNKDFEMNFWRTKTGLEVDVILNKGSVAIEIKGSNNISKNDMKGVFAFREEHSPQKSIIVCNEKTKRICEGVHIYPWKSFLSELWKDKIV